MATPGIGAGDVLAACKLIYDICIKYKDAPEEFDEIAEKADATRNVIKRLEIEAATGGSLVDRAGPEADEEFKRHLQGLRSDLAKLEKLVTKYASIHDEGYGRRMLWAVMESGNLTEYRRKIGYHEAKLSFWYSALVYGSLRRLETGQEGVLYALEQMPKNQERMIKAALRDRDFGPLIKALKAAGMQPQVIHSNLPLAETYITSTPEDKCRLTDHVRTRSRESQNSAGPYRSSMPFPDYGARFSGSLRPDYQPFADDNGRRRRRSGGKDDDVEIKLGQDKSGLRRSKSSRKADEHQGKETAGPPQSGTPGADYFYDTFVRPNSRPKHARRASDIPFPDRTKAPQIVIQDERPHNKPQTQFTHRRARSASTSRQHAPVDDASNMPFRDQHTQRRDQEGPVYHTRSGSLTPKIVIHEQHPENDIVILAQSTQRRRSVSHIPRHAQDNIIVVEEEPRRSRSRGSSAGSTQRQSSTDSYHRERRRSSDASDRGVTRYKVVQKLDRIDSMPVDNEAGVMR